MQLAVLGLIHDTGGFGHRISVKFNSRTANVTTGSVAVSTVTQETVGAVTGSIDMESFFGHSTLTAMSTSVVLSPSDISDVPELHDEIAVESGVYLRVLDVNKIIAPDDLTSYPVIVAYVVALGT